MGNKAYKDLHRSLGLCTDCSEPAIKGSTRCARHHYSQKIRERKFYYKDPDRFTREARERYHKNKKKGLCPKCGRVKSEDDEGVWCIACATFRKRS